MTADPTWGECPLCGRREAADELVVLPVLGGGRWAHCRDCADKWRRRFEAKREAASK